MLAIETHNRWERSGLPSLPLAWLFTKQGFIRQCDLSPRPPWALKFLPRAAHDRVLRFPAPCIG